MRSSLSAVGAWCPVLLFALWSASPVSAQDAPAEPALEPGVYAEIKTSKGTMLARLYYKQTPRTVANFVGLAEGTKAFVDLSGKRVKRPYYDGLDFHRVIPGFMIQGGDPKGNGMGGPGYSFQDETVRGLSHDAKGILSMANSDQGKTPWSNTGRTNGSQFFITLGTPKRLDGLHTVFGKLVKGFDALEAIGKVETGPSDKPKTRVTIESIRIQRVGVGEKVVPAAKGEADPATQPQADAEVGASARVELICVMYRGCERARAEVGRDQAKALEIAKALEAHARLKGANFTELSKTYSDLPAREFLLQKGKNVAAFDAALRLKPGQVSAPFVTPYGVMIARAK